MELAVVKKMVGTDSLGISLFGAHLRGSKDLKSLTAGEADKVMAKNDEDSNTGVVGGGSNSESESESESSEAMPA
jgi:hypothetical protein